MGKLKSLLSGKSTTLILILLILLLIPTFWRMLRPGIFSMHDFHVFRLFEYDKCIADLKFPCRWAPDSAFEYGEPMFNFYAQLPYVFGELFRLVGFSVLDSIKALFICSLIFSGLGVFLLSKQIWKNNFAAMISALVYVYAPYRSVDVWVRGALPEALAFVFFPLITYFFNEYVIKRKVYWLLLFSLSLAGLVLTHNLSALMFTIFLSIWGSYLLTREKAWGLVPKFLLAGVLAFGISAFYILPVIFETNLISISKTTGGYYDFNNHFLTLNQLLISRFWGYGASLWGENDGLSLSVGQIQWILPLLIVPIILFKKFFRKYLHFFVLLGLGWFFLFLTHNKSVLIWSNIKPIAFIQFPWRFLGSAVFSFALAAGAISTFLSRKYYNFLAVLIVAGLLIGLNGPFFYEDIWFNITDREQFSGKKYLEQTSSALFDFWPLTAKNVPNKFADSKDPSVLEGSGSAKLINKGSSDVEYSVDLKTDSALIQFPIVYFPGWVGYGDNRKLKLSPKGDLGLITAEVNRSTKLVKLDFQDTPIRKVSNYISLFSIGMLILSFVYFQSKLKSNKSK